MNSGSVSPLFKAVHPLRDRDMTCWPGSGKVSGAILE